MNSAPLLLPLQANMQTSTSARVLAKFFGELIKKRARKHDGLKKPTKHAKANGLEKPGQDWSATNINGTSWPRRSQDRIEVLQTI